MPCQGLALTKFKKSGSSVYRNLARYRSTNCLVNYYIVFDTVSFPGTFKSSYVIGNAEGKLLFTIKAFEIPGGASYHDLAIQAFTVLSRITAARAAVGLVVKLLARDPAAAGKKITSDISINIVATLGELVEESGVVVRSSASLALQKIQTSRAGRSLSRLETLGKMLKAACSQVDISSSANFLVSNGASQVGWSSSHPMESDLTAFADSNAHAEDASMEVLTLAVSPPPHAAIMHEPLPACSPQAITEFTSILYAPSNMLSALPYPCINYSLTAEDGSSCNATLSPSLGLSSTNALLSLLKQLLSTASLRYGSPTDASGQNDGSREKGMPKKAQEVQ
ncbi:hypothetical protein BU15DRAFT_63877 [Melanogaster broomeanus]|nr:hypothetical protein BU15DRAFT_63877 [Melanogaster broomeanus]